MRVGCGADGDFFPQVVIRFAGPPKFGFPDRKVRKGGESDGRMEKDEDWSYAGNATNHRLPTLSKFETVD